MTEPRRADLSYGQLGGATYDTESQEWQFTRSPGVVRQIHPVGNSIVSIQPSTEIVASPPSLSGAARAHNIKELAGAYPELVPSIPLLSELVQTSEAIVKASSTLDPAVSQLLVFGKAADLDNQRSGARTVALAAIAGGDAREAVKLVRLQHEHLRWLGHRAIGLKTPTLGAGDQGWWIGNGSPIQQLCFAETEGEPSSWLAVRYSEATTILRPLLRRLPVPATFVNGPGASRKSFLPSRVDANPILSLSVEHTGGAPHADVSFNPFNAKQFAIVDQRGQWSIWNIEGQHRRRHLWTATAGPNGQICATDGDYKDAKVDTTSEAKQDGWGSIIWAGDTNTILVADRRTLAIFNVEALPQRLAVPDLHIIKDAEWILDLKRSPLDDSHIFLVTSSRILCLRIRGADQDGEVKDLKIEAEILFSTRHFRDQEDISLRLQLLSDDGDLTALLYSRLATLCTAFHVSLSPSVSDPSIVPLFNLGEVEISKDSTMANMSLSLLTLVLRPVGFANRGTTDPSGPGLAYLQSGTSFYKLFGLYNDLSVREGLYVTTSASPASVVRPPDTKSRMDTTKSSTKVWDDDLIIADGLATDDSDEYRSDGLSSHNRPSHVVGKTTKSGQDDQWAVNFEWLYEELERNMTSQSFPDTSKLHNARAFEDCLVELDSTIRDMTINGQRGMGSLFSLLDTDVVLSDVDRTSAELQDFITSIGRITADADADADVGDTDVVDDVPFQSRVVSLLTIETSSALFRPLNGGEVGSVVDLSHAYNKLLQPWISPLASSVPGKVRIGLEKRLRRTVAQLCFASLGVRLGSRPGSSNQNDGQDSMSLARLTLPVRGKGTASGHSERGKGKSRERSASPQRLLSGSQGGGLMRASAPPEASLPTPGRTPSQHSRSSMSVQDGSENPAYERLRNLTSLAAQPPLPASTSNLLGHWAVGTDPAQYDWNATRQALATASDTEGTGDDAQMTRRQRMERRVKRQRQDTLLGTSSQPQPQAQARARARASAAWDSQPEPARGTRGSSQIGESLILATSQVEPGRYGRRHVTRAKGTKRRKQGF